MTENDHTQNTPENVPAPTGEVRQVGVRHGMFGARGTAATCQCQRYKLRPREAFAKFPAAERARRLREQTHCGHPESDTTSGLVARVDGEPVGWCAVEPRPAFRGLVRNNRVPWEGRTQDGPTTACGRSPACSRVRDSDVGESGMPSRPRPSTSHANAAPARSRHIRR